MKAHRLEERPFTETEALMGAAAFWIIIVVTLASRGISSGYDLLGLIIIPLPFWMGLIIRAQKRTALERAQSCNDEIDRLKSKIIVTTTQSVPGKEITAVLGPVKGTSPLEALSSEECDAAEQEAMLSLIKNAMAMGADAVVNAQLHTSSFEVQGSKWMKAKYLWTGTAVKLAE